MAPLSAGTVSQLTVPPALVRLQVAALRGSTFLERIGKVRIRCTEIRTCVRRIRGGTRRNDPQNVARNRMRRRSRPRENDSSLLKQPSFGSSSYLPGQSAKGNAAGQSTECPHASSLSRPSKAESRYSLFATSRRHPKLGSAGSQLPLRALLRAETYSAGSRSFVHHSGCSV